MAEILARAKMAPLHLDANVYKWTPTQFTNLFDQLEAHISHICHLSISGHLETVPAQLSFSAPTLESISLSQLFTGPPATIPDNLFNGTAPNLTSLELKCCNISWKSPLLKGLQNLQILDITQKARPELKDWLDALGEMPTLKRLSLRSATPLASASPLISESSRTITLPSLTHFHIDAFAKDCALALAYLLLPGLTWPRVDVTSQDTEGDDVQLVIPYVARNVNVLQDIEPIRSILLAGERTCAEVCAWADADVKICDPVTLGNMSHSACLMFSSKGSNWGNGVDTTIFDAILMLLPVDSILTLTAHNCTRLSKEFWLRHSPRLPLLEQARLVPTSVRAFRGMLTEDTPPDGPRLPSLTRLNLLYVMWTELRTYRLGDMLIKRVEEGVPLEVLDLNTCSGANGAIRFLSEIVPDVKVPPGMQPKAIEEFFDHVGIGYYDEIDVKYDDGRAPWYSKMDHYFKMDRGDDEDEDENEDEYVDEAE